MPPRLRVRFPHETGIYFSLSSRWPSFSEGGGKDKSELGAGVGSGRLPVLVSDSHCWKNPCYPHPISLKLLVIHQLGGCWKWGYIVIWAWTPTTGSDPTFGFQQYVTGAHLVRTWWMKQKDCGRGHIRLCVLKASRIHVIFPSMPN